jgi:hypothetical protein
MRCKGNFKDDRICDLCSEVNLITHDICKQATYEAKQLSTKLNRIGYACPYRKDAVGDQYDTFYACTLINKSLGRCGDVCQPTIECEKYCKGVEG